MTPQCPSDIPSGCFDSLWTTQRGAAFCLLRRVFPNRKPCVGERFKPARQIQCNCVITMKSKPLFKPFATAHLHSSHSVGNFPQQSQLEEELEALENRIPGSHNLPPLFRSFNSPPPHPLQIIPLALYYLLFNLKTRDAACDERHLTK